MKQLASIMILTLAAAPALADVKGPGGKTIDCYCTDKSGARVELGDYICLHVDGQIFTAQCQMSLNVPMWRKTQDGCLSSSLRQQSQPALDSGLVHSQI